MTFEQLKYLVDGLLSGDSQTPSDNRELIMLYNMAINKVANLALALKLLTDDPSDRILRTAPGGSFIRMPREPHFFEDPLDIDDELAYAVAEFMASFISRRNKRNHTIEAHNIINLYNQKIEGMLDEAEDQAWLNESYGEDNIGFARKTPNSRPDRDYLNIYNR